MAISDEYLARFHGIKDAKTLWAAIKTKFDGNAESKKMQKISPQLDNEDLEQIDQYDLEEMDLKWHMVMLSIRVKRFYKKTGRKLEFNGKEPVGFDKTKGTRVEMLGMQDIRRDTGKRPVKEEDENVLVVQDGLGTYDWSYQVKEEATNFALMAFTLNPSSSSSLNYEGHLQQALKNKGIVDSGCSRHMTGNKAYLAD
nr:ribonuclease H-like domain-containing protein [Tanacetum cinerariifolium]